MGGETGPRRVAGQAATAGDCWDGGCGGCARVAPSRYRPRRRNPASCRAGEPDLPAGRAGTWQIADTGQHDILSVGRRSPRRGQPGGTGTWHRPPARARRASGGRAYRSCGPVLFEEDLLVLDTGRGQQRALDDLVATARQIGTAVESVIDGKAATVRLALTVLLAEGHLLIEDVPGVGKTMLAKALARSIDCSVRRVQFTPDLLPSDITGVSAYNQETARVRVQAGPGLREHRGRRRDQPGLTQDPVGAAGVHGGTARHRRRHHLRAAERRSW